MFLPRADCPLRLTSPAECLTSTSTRCFMEDFTPETVLLMTAGCAKSQVTKYHPVHSLSLWPAKSSLIVFVLLYSVVSNYTCDKSLIHSLYDTKEVISLHSHILHHQQCYYYSENNILCHCTLYFFVFGFRLWAHSLQEGGFWGRQQWLQLSGCKSHILCPRSPAGKQLQYDTSGRCLQVCLSDTIYAVNYS